MQNCLTAASEDREVISLQCNVRDWVSSCEMFSMIVVMVF